MSSDGAAAAAVDPDGLHAALSKIRHHTSSKLENQRAPAQLLVAIEATLTEQDATSASSSGSAAAAGARASQHALQQRQPAEYFLALDSMLETAQGKQAPPSLLPCIVYLLSIVTPHVSAGIVRARLTSIVPPVGKILSTPHPDSHDPATAENYPATLRAGLAVLQSILAAFSSDPQSLQKDAPLRSCWTAALNLCADIRPKVRRRAQELVCSTLPVDSSSGFAAAKPKHPYVSPTFDWCVRTLSTVADAGAVVTSKKGPSQQQQQHAPQYDKKSGKAKQASAAAALRQQRVSEGDNASVGIWVCGFVKQIVNVLPAASLDPLAAVLLRLPGLQNPFLSVAALDVFEAIFRNCRAPVPSGQAAALLAPTQTVPPPSSIGQKTLARLVQSLRAPAVVPSTNDVQLIPSYLRALEHALVAYSQFEDGRAAWSMVPDVWTDLFALSLSTKSDASRTSPLVRAAGRDALCALVRYCVPDAAIDEAIQASQGKSDKQTPFLRLIQLLADALGRLSLQYVHARAELLSILTAVIARLRHKYVDGGDGKRGRQAAAGPLTLNLVKQVAEMRAKPDFDQREYADAVISTAVEVCGPRMLLEALPLNLFGENGGEGRAWLLPLMRNKITNAELAHFVEHFVPLSERLFNRRAEAQQGGQDGVARPVEAKMWEALTEQVWACFPAYCDMPIDLSDAFTRQFAELLTNVIYTQPTLRPSVCKGLQALVERNEALVQSGASAETLKMAFALDQSDGRANLAHLSALAPNLLAVLFNVYSQSPSQSRGYIYECISTYLSIMKDADIASTYVKVKTTLDQSLGSLPRGRAAKEGPSAVPPVPHTMLDLLVALVPFLAKTHAEGAADLFGLACEDRLLRSHDAGVQKKTYKILSRLVEGSVGQQVLRLGPGSQGGTNRVGELLAKVRDSTADVASGAKRGRILLLATLVPNIPANELHFLPAIIPEAVLATKEANQSTREHAYELLVQMGHKMAAGGSINRGLATGLAQSAEEGGKDGDDADAENADMQGTATVQASVGEYLTMVAAGMAGATPHMISASITAISRLVYEFKDEIPAEMLDEMLSTVEVFLQSANREIVKSALGFVKVAIVEFRTALLETHLAALVPALLGWSSEHTMQFKPKIRHMFERLLRRFGYERIYALCPEESRKVVANIKKRKERARRQKRQEGGEEESDDEAGPQAPRRSAGHDAFEEVVYGSESEGSDSGSDGEDDAAVPGARGGVAKGRAKGRRQHGEQAYIMEDDDEPMDLLDRSAAVRIGAHDPNARADRRRKPGQDAAKFALDEATGRMVIQGSEDEDEDERAAPESGAGAGGGEQPDVVGAGRAYLDKERGRDGFTLSRGGAVRFNKNNKRAREQEREMEEEQVAAEEAGEAGPGAGAGREREKGKKPRREKQRIGAEFRARKAEGDVVRNGKSPYAYVPLSQVAGKKAKGRGQEIGFTGKGSKRR